jgi:alanine dehydrogenase
MHIGVPREIKDGERRVAVTPDGVRVLADAGHVVVVEQGAGAAVGFVDAAYAAAGAALTGDVGRVWSAELVVKVKELQPAEWSLLVPGTTIAGFAQLARDPRLLAAILAAGVRILAYETIRDAAGVAPLLAPMSRIAGRLAPLAGALALGTDHGGAGVMLTGVDDVPGAAVLVIGAGSAGTEAARVAAALGCRVTLVSRGAARLAAATATLAGASPAVAAHTLMALGPEGFAAAVANADLVIGAVLDPGRLSPKLLTRAHLRAMRRGSAFVDVGIDQGGIADTSRMTTLSAPTYVEEGVVHYAVPNLPSQVARTATLALAGAVLPFVRALAEHGVVAALHRDATLAAGVMVWDGAIADARLAADTDRAAVVAPWRG